MNPAMPLGPKVWVKRTVGASLFLGCLIGMGAGFFFPRVLSIAGPLACNGTYTIESSEYTVRPGQWGTARQFVCQNAATGEKEEITFPLLFIACLEYTLIVFIALSANALVIWLKSKSSTSS